MAINNSFAIVACFFLGFISIVFALQCYQCGQYNDGVGSITPCINETYMKLKECPSRDHKFCIKYISEGSTVRDCVNKCTEKDDWGSKTFCCTEEGCNAALPAATPTATAALLLIVLVMLVIH